MFVHSPTTPRFPPPALGHYSHSSHSMPSSGKGTPESCSHRKTSIEINNRYMNKKSTNIEIRCIDERSKYIQLTQSQADRVTWPTCQVCVLFTPKWRCWSCWIWQLMITQLLIYASSFQPLSDDFPPLPGRLARLWAQTICCTSHGGF